MAASFAFDAIGTKWRIDIRDNLSVEHEDSLLEKICARISAYDRAYSRFRPDSIVTHASKEAGSYVLPQDSEELFSLYKKIYNITEGKVTPLIGDVLVAAGYDAEYSLTQKEPLTPAYLWDEVLSYKDSVLIVHRPTMIDVGAGGKGHLIDLVGAVIEDYGVASYVVDAGGDIRVRSVESTPLQVGLENPLDLTEVVGVAHIVNKSICGSAGSRRSWGDFHHIIDPVLLLSPKHIVAVWVVADTTFLADMLTTALFFVSPETLGQHFSFEWALLEDGMNMRYSPHFPGEFFSAG
jgi:thiamine biosynthesis lipoprotein